MSSNAVCTTGPIRHNAWATAEESQGDGTSLEEILEATNCIGDVDVSRGDPNLSGNNGGYFWLVTFLRDADSPCQQTGVDHRCNAPGNVPKLIVNADSNEDLLGTSTRNLLYGNGGSTRGTLTVLDAANNDTRPPGVPEVQIINVYDLELTASDKFDGNPGYVLNIGGSFSDCIRWDASAAELVEALRSTSPEYAEGVMVSNVQSGLAGEPRPLNTTVRRELYRYYHVFGILSLF